MGITIVILVYSNMSIRPQNNGWHTDREVFFLFYSTNIHPIRKLVCWELMYLPTEKFTVVSLAIQSYNLSRKVNT